MYKKKQYGNMLFLKDWFGRVTSVPLVQKILCFMLLLWHDSSSVKGYDYQQKSDVAIAVYKIYINFAPTKRENAGPIAQLVRAADS